MITIDADTADQKLWLAVMQSAVADWMYGRVRHQHEAEHFLFEDKDDFMFVCRSAGLNPECVREKLRVIRAKLGLERRIQHRVA
jgi:hypothetical protein